MAQISNCLKLISKLDERDQDALVARLDELQARGVPAERAQIQAAIDVLMAVNGGAAPVMRSAAREPAWWVSGAPVSADLDALEEASGDAPYVLGDGDYDVDGFEWRIASVPIEVIDSSDPMESDKERDARFASIESAPRLERPILEMKNGRVTIIDGWHRIAVFKRRGMRSVDALVGRSLDGVTRSATRPAGLEIVEVDDGFDAMINGKRIGRLRDNLPRGAAEQLDENASVDIVKVNDEFKGQGVGSALYEAFNEKHGGRIAPSGKTSPEAWALWKRKFPEKVNAFVAAEAARIADGADQAMVIRNISDPEVARRVAEAAPEMVIRSVRRNVEDAFRQVDQLSDAQNIELDALESSLSAAWRRVQSLGATQQAKAASFTLEEIDADIDDAIDGGTLQEFAGPSGSNAKALRIQVDGVASEAIRSANRQADTPEFKAWFKDSKVVDAEGKPLLVFRGEHGATKDGDLQTKLGTYTFIADSRIASEYAQYPNDDTDTAEQPRVVPAYLRIENPVIENRDDPFVDMSDLIEKFGLDEVKKIAVRTAERGIENTGNWMEDEAGLYKGLDSVRQLVREKPELLSTLYMDAYVLLDDKDFVSLAKSKGYDGAIHIGNGISAVDVEYRVFSKEQIKSAIGNNGEFNPGSQDIARSAWRSGSEIIRLGSGGDSGAVAFLASLNQATAENPMNERVRVLDDLAAIEASKTGRRVHVSEIRSLRPGGGRRALALLVDLADKHGVTLELFPSPIGASRMSESDLRDWYGRHGFESDDTEDGEMVRYPRDRQDITRSLPRAIIAGDLGSLNNDPDYTAAKSGDLDAALRLAGRVVDADLAEQLAGIEKPIVAGVVSIEASGRNAIPQAAAGVLASRLDGDLDDLIIQSNAPKRTALGGLDRIFNRPRFIGGVQPGRNYILVDDTITQGGTFAALGRHIQVGGGNVAGVVALSGKQYSAILSVDESTLNTLREKFGDVENEFEQATGYRYDDLTQSEARYLASFKPADAVRARIIEGSGQGAGGENQGAAGKEVTRSTNRPYSNAPAALMGFRRGAPNKPFEEQRYKHVEFVRVTWEDGRSILEAQRGLNKPHALERARRNWSDAEVEAVSRDAVMAEDPSLVREVDDGMSNVTRSVARPQFYGQLQRSIEQVPDRLATMAAPQWKLWLDANAPKLGVKKDEIEWSGITDFLQLAGAKKIERGELAALAAKNAPRAAGLAMYTNGATSDDVASQIGVSPTTVLRWVKWAGITRSPSETKGVTPEKRAEAIRLYKAGDSVASVSEKTGLGTSTVHRIVVVDGSNRSLAEVAGAGEDAKNDAIALYILGLNTYEAAEQVGVSQPTVAGWVRDAGVSRGYSGAQSLRSALDRNESTRGIKGRFTSQKGGGEMFAASVYELARMHQLEADDGVAAFYRSQDRIPYGDGRSYNPDLEVVSADGEVFVEEVKPLSRLREQDVRDKAVAAMDFYRDSKKKYRVITERSIGQAGFDAIGPNDYPAEDSDRVKSALATARWSAREAGTEPAWDLEAPVFSKGRTASGADWESPSASKFDDLVYKFQDKQIDTKRVVEAIKEAGGSLRDDLNVYLNEELYHGRAAKRTEDFVNMELNPLIEDMAKAGMTIADLEEFLHARHAKEANAVIAQRNPGEPGLQDGGSGMTNAEADNYMATLPAADRQKLEAAAAKVDAIIASTRKMFVDYELESQATVDAWDGMFKHYVPLQREDKEGSPGLGQGFSIKGKETKGRTGSTRKVVDILANIAMQRERAIVRGEKNRVAQSLVGLVRANENPDFWLVDEVPTERVFNPATGLVEDRVDPMYKSRENAVVAKIKDPSGAVREHAVLFNEDDPRALRMAQALKNLDAQQLNGLLGVSAKITRYFAAVNTQYNPVFGVVNLVRDVQGAMLNLSSTPLKDDKLKIAKYTASALAGIYGDMRAARKGKNQTSQWAALWDEFQEVGGQTGYRDLFATSADRAEAIQKALDPSAWMDSKLGKVFTAGGALKVPVAQAQKQAGFLFDWLSDYNNAMENGVRLAAYKAGLERGMTKQQAASAAKNLTTNFNRKGQVAQQAGAMYAFFNAAIQGTARIGQTLFDMEPGKPKTLRLSSTGKKIVYGGIVLGSVQALALAAAGFGEEDPPEFARERSLIIPTGGKTYVSIPMPLGMHIIPNIGRVATEFVLSGFKDPIKRGIGLTAMFADAFNPIGNAGMSMQTLAPTALDPLVALTENKDWTGRPIAKTSFNKATPGHALGRDTATALSEVLSESINTLSGGNKYVAGVFSPTPDQIDYLLGQLTGGVGREYSKTEQTLKSAVRGESLPTYKIPLVGRFVGNAKGQASEGSAFYANVDKLNEIETEAKGLRADGKEAEARKLLAENPEAYLITQANYAERQAQKLRRQKSELIKAGAPREQVKAVEEQITAVMARLNRAMERLKESTEATVR